MSLESALESPTELHALGLGAAERPRLVAGHGYSAFGKTGKAGFVTGHGFSRADKANEKNGFSP
jgi:hypothetical protein